MLLILILIILISCEQNKYSRVTVVSFDYDSTNFKLKIDTLLKLKEVDISEKPIDVFFSCQKFHLPYYVPTDGIFKNASKSKECDMAIYPANVKCYKYDLKKRVVEMSVNGSGTMHHFFYTYNKKDQIIQITNMGSRYTLHYDAANNLSQLVQRNGSTTKKLVFTYN
jgi:YD repeat-containing protein